MKTEIQIVKDLVKKYPNDMQLGAAVRSYLNENYWRLEMKKKTSPKSKWERELDKI